MKKAIFNVLTSLFKQALTIICGFITTKMIIVTYGSSANGLVTLISYFLGFTIVLECGFDSLIKSHLFKPLINKDKKEISSIMKASETFFRRVAIFFAIYVAFLCILFPIYNKEFDTFYTIILIISSSFYIFVDYFFERSYNLLVEADQCNYVRNNIDSISLIARIIIVPLLISIRCDLRLLKLVISLIISLKSITSLLYIKKKYNVNLKGVKEEEINNKTDAIPHHLASIVKTNIGVIILSLFTNNIIVSIYGIYYMVIERIESFIVILVDAVISLFGKIVAKDDNMRLKKNFSKFEIVYYSTSSIVLISTFYLLLPIITIYTNGITDANYVKPLFSSLAVITLYIELMYKPYNDLVLAKGDFKQTKNGAIIQIVLSVILCITLVKKYDLVGIVIGIMIPTIIRGLEIIIYCSKNILKRSVISSLKNISLSIIEFAIIFVIMKNIHLIEYTGYISWIKNATFITLISMIIIIPINLLFNKKHMV